LGNEGIKKKALIDLIKQHQYFYVSGVTLPNALSTHLNLLGVQITASPVERYLMCEKCDQLQYELSLFPPRNKKMKTKIATFNFTIVMLKTCNFDFISRNGEFIFKLGIVRKQKFTTGFVRERKNLSLQNSAIYLRSIYIIKLVLRNIGSSLSYYVWKYRCHLCFNNI